MKTKTKRPTLEWTGYATDEDVQDYRDQWNDSADEADQLTTESDDEVRALMDDDGFYWTSQWEYFCEYLTELMNGQEFWRDDASGMGWQSRTGYKVFKAETGQELVDAITPNTSEFSLSVTPYYKGFKVRISHHDAPMGEYHVIKPITEREYIDLTD